jgi:hypothetical protein
MRQRTQGTVLAARIGRDNRLWFVEQVPGDGGKDWGYTSKRENALLLNRCFAKRFEADSKSVRANYSMTDLA